MPVINTNVNALFSQNALKVNSRNLTSAMEQLSTGSRINSAKDDAAGLAIGNIMTSNIRGLSQAVRNANDGISMAQTAEGAMIEQTNMLQRMRELAVQSSNSTNSDKQREYLQSEYSSLQVEITRIASNTTWNQAGLFGVSLVYQAGMSSGQTISVQIASMDSTSLGLVAANTVSTFAKSQAAIGLVDSAIDIVNAARSTMGGIMNQMSYSADNMVNISTNIAASRSTVMDTDYATASSQLSRTQIIQQAATAMLAQANQQPQSVLALIK